MYLDLPAVVKFLLDRLTSHSATLKSEQLAKWLADEKLLKELDERLWKLDVVHKMERHKNIKEATELRERHDKELKSISLP